LDTAEAEREAAEKVRKTLMQYFGKEKPSFDEIRQVSRAMHKKTIKLFDDALKSRWMFGDKRFDFRMFKDILVMEASTDETILAILERIDNLNKTTTLLGEMIIENQKFTQEKTAELNESLSKLKTTLSEPRIAKVVEILEKIDIQMDTQVDKRTQENKKALGEYSR